MNKTLTISIPDELWVDSFTKNLSAQFQYSGPDAIWIKVDGSSIFPMYYTEEPSDLTVSERSVKIDLSSATEDELALAIILTSAAVPHEYEYTEEINHDGSVYQRITNPKLSDYYYASYIDGKVKRTQVLKDPINPNEEIALQRKDYVMKYAKAFEFGETEQSLIDSFLTKIDAYLELMKTAYPWKYIHMDVNEIPKIPVTLVTIFNALPPLN